MLFKPQFLKSHIVSGVIIVSADEQGAAFHKTVYEVDILSSTLLHDGA
jgi:hypothetical protein